MEEKITRAVLWNRAGIAGLVLGLVSTAYMFITEYTAGMEAQVVAVILNFVLWAAKFCGCVWLMMYFMKRFAADYGETDNRDCLRFGAITSFCSALIYSAASLAYVLKFNPEQFEQQMNAVVQNYSQALDANSLAAMDSILQSIPQIVFFSNLIYCFLFGWVLSAILSRFIPSRNPFGEINDDDDE